MVCVVAVYKMSKGRIAGPTLKLSVFRVAPHMEHFVDANC